MRRRIAYDGCMQSLLAVIDLNRIRQNAGILSRIAARPLIAVVKDDAYGHGAERVALALEGEVAAFAVATVEEGAALRTAGIQKEILVLTPPLSQEEALRISAYRLTATLSGTRSLKFAKGQKGFKAHIAVNTGMNRYGVRLDRVKSLCRGALSAGIEITGVYSHFYDPAEVSARGEQIRRFLAASVVVQKYFPSALRHLSATGGVLAGTYFDAVRVGISLYGYLPEGFSNIGVKPALKIYATVVETRTALGSGVGYQRAEKNYKKLHTLRLGYGDGFFRESGPCIGKLCMDACIAEGAARPGTRKLVLADAAAYAKQHGTTAYEVLVNVTKRAVREYRNG
ncbi:MAG: alanine racemase [Clostridia bacterium]|nr:alanine racemase [Clostridia bacterium]